MNIWIDVENLSGVRFGSGPIRTATAWQSTARLDRAGEFSFEMPATDPQSVLLQPKRIVRCYGIVNEVVTELGAGIIDRIDVRVGDPTMIAVSGSDLLRELTYQSVGVLDIWEYVKGSPQSVIIVHPGDDVDLTETYDGNPATYDSFALALHTPLDDIPGDYVYVAHDTRFKDIEWVFKGGGSVNSNAGTAIQQFYSGVVGGWSIQTIADGTHVGTAMFARSGTAVFTPSRDWAPEPTGGLYIQRVRPSADLTTVDLAEVYIWGAEETDDALALVGAKLPAGWAFGTAPGYASTGGLLYHEFEGENCLEVLIALAEQSGEHFRLGTGRKIVWLRNDPMTATANVRAVRIVDAIAAEANTAICFITSLTRTADSYDLISRIYPRGAGIGSGQVTLARATRTPVAGYTMGTADNYIERTAAIATCGGTIGPWVAFKDVVPKENAEPHLTHAANALYDVAYEYLRKNSALNQAYEVTVAKLDQAVYPGDTVRVVYSEWVDGYNGLAIDADLIVLEATTEVSEQGVRTARMVLSTIDAWPESEAEKLRRRVMTIDRMAGRNQPMNTIDTSGFQSPTPAALNTVLISTGAGNTHFRDPAQLETTPLAHVITGPRHTLPAGATAGQAVTVNTAADGWELTTPGGGGHVIQEEGTPLTARANLNFVGARVTATDDAGNDATIVTIVGGGNSIASGAWLLDANDTVALQTFPVGEAGNYPSIIVHSTDNDVTINIYCGGANPAIVATRDSGGDWTIERHDPSDATLLDSQSGGSGDVSSLVTWTGGDILSIAVGDLYSDEIVTGANTVDQIGYWLVAT